MGSADSIDGRRETKELRLIEFARRPSRVRSKAPEDWRSPRPGPAEIGASFWSAATESSESPLWVGLAVSAASFGSLWVAGAKAGTSQTPSPQSKT